MNYAIHIRAQIKDRVTDQVLRSTLTHTYANEFVSNRFQGVVLEHTDLTHTKTRLLTKVEPFLTHLATLSLANKIMDSITTSPELNIDIAEHDWYVEAQLLDIDLT